jgi:putative heme transporter
LKTEQHPPRERSGALAGYLIPDWFSRVAETGWRVLAIVALAAVALAGAIYLSTVTSTIAVAFIVAATVEPVVEELRRRGWRPAWAAAAGTLLAVVLAVGAAIVIALAFTPYVADLIRAARDGLLQLGGWLTSQNVPPVVIQLMGLIADQLQGWFGDAIGQLVEPVATLVTVLILGGFLTFYALADADRAWDHAMLELDPSRAHALTVHAVTALRRAGGHLRWLAARASLNGIAAAVFLSLLGVPNSGPLAILVFVGSFVPYLGTPFTTLVVALVMLAAVGPLPAIVWLVLMTATALIQARLLRAKLYPPADRIHPALVLIATLAGASIFGVAGLLLAVPVVAVVVTLAPVVVRTLDAGGALDASDRLVPAWLDRLGQLSWRVLIVMGAAAIGIALLFVAPVVTASALIAIIIATALRSPVRKMAGRGTPRSQAALAVTVSGFAIVGAAVAVSAISIVETIGEITRVAEGAAAASETVAVVGLVHGVNDTLLATVAAVVDAMGAIVVILVTTGILTFVLLRDGDSWWKALVDRFPEPRRQQFDATGSTAARILNGSTIGTTIAALFAALSQWLTMVALGLPLAFPIAVLAFFGAFIPYVGSIIPTLLGFLVAVAVGSPTDIVVMGIFTIVLNLVQGSVVVPLVMGRSVHLHPAIILLAVPAGAQIAGIMGMILIVPVLGIIAGTWRNVVHLLDPNHAMSPPVSVWRTAENRGEDGA